MKYEYIFNILLHLYFSGLQCFKYHHCTNYCIAVLQQSSIDFKSDAVLLQHCGRQIYQKCCEMWMELKNEHNSSATECIISTGSTSGKKQFLFSNHYCEIIRFQCNWKKGKVWLNFYPILNLVRRNKSVLSLSDVLDVP